MGDVFAFPSPVERQLLAQATPRVPEESRQRAPLQRPLDLVSQDLAARIALLEQRIKILEGHITLSSTLLLSLGSGVWRLRKPLPVTIEQRSADEFISCVYDANLFGYGDNIPEALDDLREVIVNQVEDLQEDEESLSDALAQQLTFLREYVAKSDV